MKFRVFVLAVLSVLMMALPIAPRQAFAQSGFDSQRESDLVEIVSAYEAYGQIYGSYKIPGAGFESRGYGSFRSGGSETFPFSLADGLVAAGVLDGNDLPDEPSVTEPGYAVFLCLDRVGVFSMDDDLTADPGDVSWWNANCDSTPFTSWDRTFFELSDPYVFQGVNVSPVTDVVSAIDAYGERYKTYVIEEAGNSQLGYGWFSRRNQASYDESILNTLLFEGLLNANNLPEDPDQLPSVTKGMYVRRCSNRVGVFALASAESGSEPSVEDAAWWADNNCSRAILDNYDHTYYELSEPLDYDQVRLDATAEIVAAMDTVANAEATAFLGDMGYQDEGWGWYAVENGTSYEVSVVNGLARAGYLNPFDLPANDPFETLDYRNGYWTTHCLKGV